MALNANAIFGLKDRLVQKEQIAKARQAFAAENYPETIRLMKDFTLRDAPKRRIKRAYILIADSYIAMEEYDKAMVKPTVPEQEAALSAIQSVCLWNTSTYPKTRSIDSFTLDYLYREE